MTTRTYLLTDEKIALDTVKTAVQMGLEVRCERVEGGWLISVTR